MRHVAVSIVLMLSACAQSAPAQSIPPYVAQQHRAPGRGVLDKPATARKLDDIDAAIRAAERRLIEHQDAQQSRR